MQPQVTPEQLKSLKLFSVYLQSYGAKTATKDYNINPIKKSTQEVYEVNEDIKELIIRENKKDYELYNECLKIAGYK